MGDSTVSDLNEKRELNRGFGDGMSRAFEFAATPLVFGALGYGVDTLLDTRPVFTIVLATFAVVGMFIRLWYGYDAEMREQEQRIVRRTVADAADTVEDAAADLWARRRTAEPRPAGGPDA